MRKPKPADQTPVLQHSDSVRYFIIGVMILTACAITLSGCSKFGLQEPAGFSPIPQRDSITQEQQRSIDEAFEKQDAARLVAEAKAAAEKAAAEAEKAAADKAAEMKTAVEDAVSEAKPGMMPESVSDLETQQQEIVAEAAQRADFIEATQIAQVSYEVEFEETENEPGEDIFFGPVFEGEEVVIGVRLIAKADDLEGVPVNFARDEVDLSQANFLRTGNADPAPLQATDTPVETTSKPPEFNPPTYGNGESLLLPLQPMLFNANTRATKSIYEGTLRPLVPSTQKDFESEIVVTKVANETTPQHSPLSPLSTGLPTIKLRNNLPAPTAFAPSNSRLLRPIARTPVVAQPPAVEFPGSDFAHVESEPIIESSEVIILEPPAPEPPVETLTVAGWENPAPNPNEPIVDKNLASLSPSYLQPATKVVEQFVPETIPVEVFEDADLVAQEMEQELTAAVIPIVDNDFKVQPASNTVNAESEIDHADRGEPMFSNNDFAAPGIPGGDFVAPMTVAPASIPMVQPEEIIPATSEFGKPVNLEAPPEHNPAIQHVAALPIVGRDTNLPGTSSVPPVGISTLMELNAVTWKSRLDEAIELAEARLNQMKSPSDSGRVNLRLLKALRGQMEQVENAPGNFQLSENEAQYWQHQLEAITAMLQTPAGDNQAITDYHRHQTAHETLEHLRHAVAQLESIASLKVNSGQFCTEVTGFGQFKTFPSTVFSAGQRMLIYCEVENYKTIEHQSVTGGDFRTRLRGSFAIYDVDGKVVQQAEFPSVDDVARKRRRDFYMYMPVTLADLPQGQYVLHALVEDIYGNKTASLDPPLNFSVK